MNCQIEKRLGMKNLIKSKLELLIELGQLMELVLEQLMELLIEELMEELMELVLGQLKELELLYFDAFIPIEFNASSVYYIQKHQMDSF
ncbi:hypothetical protein BpHYR1_046911 [Brachionus plicatilis]|uniref:Uncharacterized protein n=1 Tax=Brachionus plicatilis TaxID=10195 RepID=A0A3M7RJ99_BRAPC|nr:hypothetical protein BpHYR1_046911 [Brachionus plicatilis]